MGDWGWTVVVVVVVVVLCRCVGGGGDGDGGREGGRGGDGISWWKLPVSLLDSMRDLLARN